jgi:hypothetical protein
MFAEPDQTKGVRTMRQVFAAIATTGMGRRNNRRQVSVSSPGATPAKPKSDRADKRRP